MVARDATSRRGYRICGFLARKETRMTELNVVSRTYPKGVTHRMLQHIEDEELGRKT
jgi:hypothetical protein